MSSGWPVCLVSNGAFAYKAQGVEMKVDYLRLCSRASDNPAFIWFCDFPSIAARSLCKNFGDPPNLWVPKTSRSNSSVPAELSGRIQASFQNFHSLPCFACSTSHFPIRRRSMNLSMRRPMRQFHATFAVASDRVTYVMALAVEGFHSTRTSNGKRVWQ